MGVGAAEAERAARDTRGEGEAACVQLTSDTNLSNSPRAHTTSLPFADSGIAPRTMLRTKGLFLRGPCQRVRGGGATAAGPHVKCQPLKAPSSSFCKTFRVIACMAAFGPVSRRAQGRRDAFSRRCATHLDIIRPARLRGALEERRAGAWGDEVGISHGWTRRGDVLRGGHERGNTYALHEVGGLGEFLAKVGDVAVHLVLHRASQVPVGDCGGGARVGGGHQVCHSRHAYALPATSMWPVHHHAWAWCAASAVTAT